ncbi:MAG: hypothetical protein K6E29_09090 [Cyanobacteria bacterium RUI128]|nr:hypothetical protein [Cyanobacteria bacterium RUI128]
MKKILCFGDSNTYGYIPVSGERYDEDIRWTGILKQKFANDYKIIEAGCNNRNGFIDSIFGAEFTGYKVLPQYLKNNPDIVILALGINDLQKSYRPQIEDISQGLKSMVLSVKESGAEFILISPPVLNTDVLNGYFSFQFDEISVNTSKLLPNLYKNVAEQFSGHYINPNDYISVSKEDGLHYTKEGHSTIANLIYNYIKEILQPA